MQSVSAKSVQVDEDESSACLFKELASRVSALGASIGVRIIPFKNPSLPFFSALESQKKQRIITNLKNFIEICEATIAEGHSLRDSKSLVWKAIKYFGLRPPSDLFNFVENEEVVEIYETDNYQAFRNFRFFELCSYSLEQIYSIPWTELWYRDEEAMAGMIEFIGQCLGSDQTKTAAIHKPTHKITELASPFKFELNYKTKGIAPLWDNSSGQKAGFVIISVGEILNQISASEEERKLLEYSKNERPSLQLL